MGSFLSRIVIFRQQFATEMGFFIPTVQLSDSALISPSQYVIKLKGDEIARGEILIDYF